jgi:hypothetical protein
VVADKPGKEQSDEVSKSFTERFEDNENKQGTKRWSAKKKK